MMSVELLPQRFNRDGRDDNRYRKQHNCCAWPVHFPCTITMTDTAVFKYDDRRYDRTYTSAVQQLSAHRSLILIVVQRLLVNAYVHIAHDIILRFRRFRFDCLSVRGKLSVRRTYVRPYTIIRTLKFIRLPFNTINIIIINWGQYCGRVVKTRTSVHEVSSSTLR